MATLATYFRRPEMMVYAETQAPTRAAAVRVEASPYALRSLPYEDVFFFSKKIDNSRVVKEADPRARGACWSTIGAACLLAVLMLSVLVPNVLQILDGYKVQALRQEQQRLLVERRVLDLEEARLLSPARLQQLARDQKLVAPVSNQIVHLDSRTDGSLSALNVDAH
jgi:hypothetical protein